MCVKGRSVWCLCVCQEAEYKVSVCVSGAECKVSVCVSGGGV